jgi:uncharacterized protein
VKHFAAAIATATLVTACASAEEPFLPPHFARLSESQVEVATASGIHRFEVWIAADDESRERGLMHVRKLPPERGMLFVFDRPQYAAFWMKDTPLPLDLVFIAPDGRVLNIAEDTRPLSLAPIESDGPVSLVLELAAGTAGRIQLAPGDRIRRVTAEN